MHEGVLVGAVQRVARLERHDAIPAALGDIGANLFGGKDVFAERGVLLLREDVDDPAE